MAFTVQYQPVELVETGVAQVPNFYNIAAANGQTLTDGDFATIAGGQLSKAAANAAIGTIAGLVFKGNDSLYRSATPSKTTLFGADQSGTALLPGTNQTPTVIGLSQVQLWINLVTTTTLAASLIGTQVGLGYDATSGYFFVDPGQANKIAQIIEISAGPDSQLSGVGAAGVSNGQIGDNGGRVKISFLSGLALL